MNDVTRLLSAVTQGQTKAAEDLLPLVYDELRRLAAQKMAGERSDHTLQATALVHEAYLRLVGNGEGDKENWNDRMHFFSTAAEAMRRILIDSARKKLAIKRGGKFQRTTWNDSQIQTEAPPEEMLAVDEALEKLAEEDVTLARVVSLRYFAGMTIREIAEAMEVSPSTVDRQWACARAWLYREISQEF